MHGVKPPGAHPCKVEVVRTEDAAELVLNRVPPLALVASEEDARHKVVERLEELPVLQSARAGNREGSAGRGYRATGVGRR